MNKFDTKYLPYFPIFGLGLYLIVFYFAASAYPGGSYNYPNANNGYSFSNNFLCDAMNPITESGAINNARPIAIISHLILSLTMISFFYILPKVFNEKNRNTQLITYFGIASMTALLFMFTPYHDLMVTFTGVLGTMAMIPLFIELRRFKNKGLKRLMYFCFTLSIIVFLSFQTKIGFYYLPFLQKITFAIDTWWVVSSCLFVINKNRAAVKLVPQKVNNR
ncbi:hypothetical protein JBL43_02405 [Aureibaculum sp. A20]|uniref:DUF998 domain-containing protein n=1 Tax=Aureibaculum flavum TaxID=2795986 RepID=A0ABS0WM68_9FLAO|nr:hypothetical protein [Aureibaculum flavum]MBJ2173072.1 hypothetical protein [Aureibaculum flavum]